MCFHAYAYTHTYIYANPFLEPREIFQVSGSFGKELPAMLNSLILRPAPLLDEFAPC